MRQGSTGKYAALYRDPRWQKKRLEIMERDGFECCHCHSKTATLNVHHAFYDKGKKPWEYDNEILITLCNDCHEKWHRAMKRVQYEVMHINPKAMFLFADLIAVSGIEVLIETVYQAYYGKECDLWRDEE